jgi:hypothetical protein
VKNLVRLLLCLALAGFTIARATEPGRELIATAGTMEKKPTGQKADAKTLLDAAKKAHAAMVKVGRADQDLDPKEPTNKPFWKSLHLIARSLKTADKGLGAKSNDFFTGVADARQAEEQMKVDWQLTGSKNENVIENEKKLGNAIALLRTDFSKEAERKKKGGELTAKEKTAFDKIKAQQKELLAKITKLEKAAQKDKAFEKGLREVEKQADHILKEPATVDAYVATLYLIDAQIGLIRGYEYYVDEPWRADYLTLVTFTNTYDTIYSEWEISVSYDWASVDTSVDIYEGEEVDVSESVADEEINSEESFVENESFDLSEAEKEEVAADADANEEVASDEESIGDASDDEGEDMRDDDSGDDDGGDDGSDDGGADEGD